MTSKLKPRSPKKAVLKTVPPSPKKKTAAPWTRSVGQQTTFYLEGGHGDNYWAGGWHLGSIRALPIKGRYKGWAQVELSVPLYGWSDGEGHNRNGAPLAPEFLKRPRGHYVRGTDKAWVSMYNLNEPGDTTYHGPKLDEMVAERKAEKLKDVKAAARKVRVK